MFGGTRILQNENKVVKYNTMLSYNTLDYQKVDIFSIPSWKFTQKLL